MEKTLETLSKDFQTADEEYLSLFCLPANCEIAMIIYDKDDEDGDAIVDRIFGDSEIKETEKTEFIDLAKKLFGKVREKKLKELKRFVAEMK
jgi:hypothetical protein